MGVDMCMWQRNLMIIASGANISIHGWMGQPPLTDQGHPAPKPKQIRKQAD